MRHLHHAVPVTIAPIVEPAEHWPTSQVEYSDLMVALGHTIAERDLLRVEVARLEQVIALLQP